MKTAEEFTQDKIDGRDNKEICADCMIKFARLHLDAQKEAILKILKARGTYNNINKNIILNAYPNTLIK